MGFIFLAGCGKEPVRNGNPGVHKLYATARRLWWVVQMAAAVA